MRLRCNMRVQFGDTIYKVGEVIEREYEEVKNAIRDRALTPLPDLPQGMQDPAQNAHDAAVKQAETVNITSEAPVVPSDTLEVKED